MKLTVGLISFFSFLSALAQPSLQSPYDLVPGYGYSYREITNATSFTNIALSGSNVTWDFTTV